MFAIPVDIFRRLHYPNEKAGSDEEEAAARTHRIQKLPCNYNVSQGRSYVWMNMILSIDEPVRI